MMENLCQRLKKRAFGEGRQKLSRYRQTFEQIPLTFHLLKGKIHMVLCTVDWGVWPHTVSFISGNCRELAFCAPMAFKLVLSALWQFQIYN
jgi:hypothetical protein